MAILGVPLGGNGDVSHLSFADRVIGMSALVLDQRRASLYGDSTFTRVSAVLVRDAQVDSKRCSRDWVSFVTPPEGRPAIRTSAWLRSDGRPERFDNPRSIGEAQIRIHGFVLLGGDMQVVHDDVVSWAHRGSDIKPLIGTEVELKELAHLLDEHGRGLPGIVGSLGGVMLHTLNNSLFPIHSPVDPGSFS
jgi:hypothetical protein